MVAFGAIFVVAGVDIAGAVVTIGAVVVAVNAVLVGVVAGVVVAGVVVAGVVVAGVVATDDTMLVAAVLGAVADVVVAAGVALVVAVSGNTCGVCVRLFSCAARAVNSAASCPIDRVACANSETVLVGLVLNADCSVLKFTLIGPFRLVDV